MATVNSLPEWPTNCYAQKICVLACHSPLRPRFVVFLLTALSQSQHLNYFQVIDSYGLCLMKTVFFVNPRLSMFVVLKVSETPTVEGLLNTVL